MTVGEGGGAVGDGATGVRLAVGANVAVVVGVSVGVGVVVGGDVGLASGKGDDIGIGVLVVAGDGGAVLTAWSRRCAEGAVGVSGRLGLQPAERSRLSGNTRMIART